MRIRFQGNQSTLTAMPPAGDRSFRVGQVLWKDALPDGALEVLGSDGAYHSSLLTFEGPDRLHIDVDRKNSPGNDQTWERAGPSIDGVWVLRAGTEPANLGLQVQVAGDEGRVGFLPATVTARLRVGNLLWRAIRGGGNMEARVNGSYQAARVDVLDQDRLRVSINLASGAVEETWVRRGSDAERIGLTGTNLVTSVRQSALATGAPLAQRSIRSLLVLAADSIASPSWGTVELGGESMRFLVLGCRIGSGPSDPLFVRGAGEAPDGRAVEVELERSLQDDRVLERASILFGDRFGGEVWTVSGGFTSNGNNLRAEGRFRSRGTGARDGVVEVGCEP
jgi:hypothetical protein